MSTLAIIALSALGACGWFMTAAYVYMRLIWYMRQRDRYAMAEAAFFGALLLPIGVAVLAVYRYGDLDQNGLPPRHVRRERRRLEEELGIHDR